VRHLCRGVGGPSKISEVEVDVECLIRLVEERPVLWDKTLDTYKDINLIEPGWKEVCLELKNDFEDLGEKDKK
jgi:hypothetical protein